MSSQALPKEQRSAYQRWELDSFDAPKKNGKLAVLPTASQLERLHQQAHEEGYAAGRREGSAKVAAETQRLQQIVAALTEEAQRIDQRIAEDLLGLALTISKQVLRQALEAQPELILAVIHEVLGQMPLSHQRARLLLHPEDATLVQLALGDRLKQAGWEIVHNTETRRGGCRLESAECEVDATLERRWQRVVEAIGSDHAWTE